MEYNNQCNCQPHEIAGIKCEVQECEFHAGGDACNAGKIIVGCPAGGMGETCCNTFKQKH